MSAKMGFSLSDLQGGAKALNNVAPPAQSKSGGGISDSEAAAQQNLIDIYEKHGGDLDLIFEELNSNPTKAKKAHNRPKDAQEFAKKFLAGFYNLLADDDSKNNVAEAKEAK